MTAIPCKRPKITTEPHASISGLWNHVCHVPGCAWSFISVKSAQEVTWHREDHRRAVPELTITRDNGHPYRVACSCGFDRSDGRTTTRIDAECVRDWHLTDKHGLVVC